MRKSNASILEQKNTSHPALAELRQELKEKFAEAHRDYTPRESIGCGVDWIDRAGLEKGTLCEISARGSSPAGGAVVLGQILQHIIRERQRLVLIDGADAFDPSILPAFAAHPGGWDLDGSLIWARCRGVAEAVKVADMIVRDGNLPRTVIDLQMNDPKEIRAIPASSWLRLRSLAEDSGVSSLVITPEPVINCAAARFEIKSRFHLDDLECPQWMWLQKSTGQTGRTQRRVGMANSYSMAG